MKRETELMQKLLVKLEDLPAQAGDVFLFTGAEPELAIEGYSSAQIEYHLTQLVREGYVDSPGSQPMVGITFRSLTPRGHDFADEYRETLQQRAIRIELEERNKWISAAEAVHLLKPAFKSDLLAKMTICERAHAGLIRARAEKFIVDNKPEGECEIPAEFWWAEGHEALEQNWTAGDFGTWLRQRTRLRAFGVSFLRSDVEKIIPAGALVSTESRPLGVQGAPAAPAKGGRYPAEFWDDLWVEIGRQLYEGDLKPKKQVDIEGAMMDWLASRGETPGVTTIRERARKLWQAIKDGN
ncbi:DUF2513 domain-containing protein [Bradyrhizobium liaoningense]